MIKSEAPRAAVDMELEETQADAPSAPAEEAVDGSVVKKQKVDKSVEEERLEKLEEGEGRGEGEILEEEKSGPITIGPKTFESSTDMFDYFFKFLHHWSPNFDVNKVFIVQGVFVCIVQEGSDERDGGG